MAQNRRINMGSRTKAGTSMMAQPGGALRRMSTRARRTAKRADTLMRENPKSALAIGVGVGAALGALTAYLLQRRGGR